MFGHKLLHSTEKNKITLTLKFEHIYKYEELFTFGCKYNSKNGHSYSAFLNLKSVFFIDPAWL